MSESDTMSMIWRGNSTPSDQDVTTDSMMASWTPDALSTIPGTDPGTDTGGSFSLESAMNCAAGSLMTLVTFLGQVMVFMVVSRDKRLRSAGNMFIISLATADLLISLVSMPVWTVYSTLGYWPMSQALCDVWNVLDYVLCCVSIYTIMFISLDRWLSLKFTINYQVHRTKSNAKRALITIWVVTAIMFSCYIGITQVVLGKERDPLGCGTYYLTSVPLTVCMITMVHFTGVGVTGILYILIFRITTNAGKLRVKSDAGTTKKKQAKTEISSVSVTKDTSSESINLEMNTNSTTNIVKKAASPPRGDKGKDDNKALKTIALLLATFAVCWLPLAFIFLIEAVKPGYLSPWFMIGGYWLGYINSMLNPLSYAVGNPYFRETLFNMIGCGARTR